MQDLVQQKPIPKRVWGGSADMTAQDDDAVVHAKRDADIIKYITRMQTFFSSNRPNFYSTEFAISNMGCGSN